MCASYSLTYSRSDNKKFVSLFQDYGVRGFPTIKVFVPGKPPIDYQGARDANSIAKFTIKQVCRISLLILDKSLIFFIGTFSSDVKILST